MTAPASSATTTRRTDPPVRPEAGDVLMVVDVQRDFLPGGALGVRDGDAVVPVLNRYLARFAAQGLPVVFTRDWHPPDHCSFRARGGPWPPHCIAGTPGAGFAPGLALPAHAEIVSKATTAAADAYSGFDHTGLADRLHARGVRRLFIGGLATDYCVQSTTRDGLAAGFSVFVLGDAIRAVDVQPGDGERALAAMLAGGARLIAFDDLEDAPA
jgi:nicotinamidase/pyrazinamidase